MNIKDLHNQNSDINIHVCTATFLFVQKYIYLVSYFIAYFIYIRICRLLHTHMVKCYYSFLFCTFLVLFHSRQNTCNLHKPYTKVWYVDHYISFCKKYIWEKIKREREKIVLPLEIENTESPFVYEYYSYEIQRRQKLGLH